MHDFRQIEQIIKVTICLVDVDIKMCNNSWLREFLSIDRLVMSGKKSEHD